MAKIEAGDALTTLEAKIIEGGGSPLGGAKPKALIEIEGEQWAVGTGMKHRPRELI